MLTANRVDVPHFSLLYGVKATARFSVRFDVKVRQCKGDVRSPLPGAKDSSQYRGSVHTPAHNVRVRSTLAMLRSVQYTVAFRCYSRKFYSTS